MTRKKKLIQKAISGSELTISELCSLAESLGFEFRNQNGSHRIYKHPKLKGTMNFQPDKNNKARKYQLRQLIDFAMDNDLI